MTDSPIGRGAIMWNAYVPTPTARPRNAWLPPTIAW